MVAFILVLFWTPILALRVIFLFPATEQYALAQYLISHSLEMCRINLCTVQEVTESSPILETLTGLTPDVVFDFSEDTLVIWKVARLAEELGFHHVIARDLSNTLTNSVPFRPRVNDEIKLLGRLMNTFQWQRAAVFFTTNEASMRLEAELKAVTDIEYVTFVLPDVITQTQVDRIVSRSVKAQGINIIVMGGSRDVANAVLQAAVGNWIYKQGFAFILLPSAVSFDKGKYEDGVLLLAPSSSVKPESDVEIDLIRCEQIIAEVEAGQPISTIASPDFIIYNQQYGDLVPVFHYFSNTFEVLNSSVVFPGLTLIPPSSKLEVLISINLNIDNPPGMEPDYSMLSYTYGSKCAVSDVNGKLQMLPGFNLNYTNLSYGVDAFNATWALPKIKAGLRYRGIADIVGPTSDGAIGLTNVLETLNETFPMIGTTTSASILNSTASFPYFVRVYMSDDYMVVTYIRIINYFGWKKCAILYLNNTWGLGIYQKFKEVVPEYGIEIINNETLRAVDNLITDENRESYQAQFTELIICKARILILVLYTAESATSINYLYDLGVRRGEVLFLAIEWLSIDLVSNNTNTSALLKQRELLEGSLMCIPEAYLGNIGESLSDRLITAGLESNHMPCFNYDAVLLAAYALKDALWQGSNYDDPNQFMLRMRETRFIGCTGLVTLEQGTNDRSLLGIGIYNLQQNESTGNWSLAKVMLFDPLSVQVFTVLGEIEWPGHSSVIPTDSRVDLFCPNESHLQDFSEGRLFALAIYIYFLVFTVSAQIIALWCVSRRHHKLLRCRHEISYSDQLVYLYAVIEMMQLISIGPTLTHVSAAITNISYICSFTFIGGWSDSSGYFWAHMQCALGITSLWLVMNLVTYFHIWERIERVPLCKVVEGLAEWIIPLVANLFFLPLLAQLMDIFFCDRAYSDSFPTSVLRKDCYQGCWTGTHLTYAIPTFLLAMIYAPLALIVRPYWEHSDTALHIHTQPTFAVLRTLVQLSLIVAQKMLLESFPGLHQVIFLSALGVYFLMTLVRKPFTYVRLSMWQIIGICAVLWLELVEAALGLWVGSELIGTVLVAGGWTVLWILGMLIQKRFLPYLLYTPQGVDMMQLFKFGFNLQPPDPQAPYLVRKFTFAHSERRYLEASSRPNIPTVIIA